MDHFDFGVEGNEDKEVGAPEEEEDEGEWEIGDEVVRGTSWRGLEEEGMAEAGLWIRPMWILRPLDDPKERLHSEQ